MGLQPGWALPRWNQVTDLSIWGIMIRNLERLSDGGGKTVNLGQMFKPSMKLYRILHRVFVNSKSCWHTPVHSKWFNLVDAPSQSRVLIETDCEIHFCKCRRTCAQCGLLYTCTHRQIRECIVVPCRAHGVLGQSTESSGRSTPLYLFGRFGIITVIAVINV